MDEQREDLVAALDEVCVAATESSERNAAIVQRAGELQDASRTGKSLRAVVGDGRPLLVDLLRENLEALAVASSRLRRAQVVALYAEGSTTDEIARLFGVTRQRISTLLRDGRARRTT